MTIKLKNNVVSTLTTTISASDVGLAVEAGTGALFPVLTPGDYFYATLKSVGGVEEIVKVTARVGDSMAMVRAQEGTVAQSFGVGSRIEARITAQSIYDAVQDGVDSITLESLGLTVSAEKLNSFTNLTSTIDELNKLTGLTATTAELNKLSGMTASTAELNKLTGLTATTSELNKLTGLTASTAELNKLTGLTATTAQLNSISSLTATPAQINILSGLTVTAAEINRLSGITTFGQSLIQSPNAASARATLGISALPPIVTLAEIQAGTSTDMRIVTPAVLKEAIQTTGGGGGGGGGGGSSNTSIFASGIYSYTTSRVTPISNLNTIRGANIASITYFANGVSGLERKPTLQILFTTPANNVSYIILINANPPGINIATFSSSGGWIPSPTGENFLSFTPTIARKSTTELVFYIPAMPVTYNQVPTVSVSVSFLIFTI